MQKTNNEFVEGRSCQRPRLRGHEGGEPEAKKKGEGCFRFCRRGSTVNEEERGSRKKAIRLKCLDCCCGSAYEVRLCPARQCPLWRFRLGTEGREESTENAEGSQENCSDKSLPVGKEVLK